MREGTGERHAIPANGSLLVVGRARDADVPVLDARCSRRQFGLRAQNGAVWFEPLSSSVPTRVNGTPRTQAGALAHGDRLEVAQVVFRVECADGGAAAEVAERAHRTPAPRHPDRIALAGELVLGRAEDAGLRLDHPSVSRAHALVELRGGHATLRDLGSKNGTFVDGRRVRGSIVLRPGDRIDLGPYALEFDGESLVRTSREHNVRLVAQDLGRTVRTPAGARLAILDGVHLVIEPREFVCLLGPSGSGKSTLMNALSAREPADRGAVYLNGVDLYASFEALKQGIALVPQHDVLHESLPLRRAIEYTARLRLPADSSRAEIARRVEEVLESVDMSAHADKRIGALSGGQKKRASLANETVSSPDLLFLDEVTSGLDEHTDHEMMRLFRGEAERGMTVVCVTHTLANVAEFCHRIVVMAYGGHLAFAGSPAEAEAYFEVERLADVYRRLGERDGADWARRFEETFDAEREVEATLEREQRAGGAASPERAANARGRQRSGEPLRQFRLVASRALRLLLADRRTLALAIGQSAFIAAALALVMARGEARQRAEGPLLFMLGISCLWFGCNNASKEIVKERFIYRRERDVNLSVGSYALAKLGVLLLLGAAQALLLLALVQVTIGVPGELAAQAGLALLAVVTGTSLGLLISAASTSTDQATTLVPIALIPQIVMSGAIFLYDAMPRAGQLVAESVVSGHWIERATALSLAGDGAGAARAAWILGAHALAYFVGAWAVLALRDRRGESARR